jgi:integrase
MKDHILTEFLERGVKESTASRDIYALNRYLKHIQTTTQQPNLTFEDLIDQAEEDLDNIPRERKRRTTQYLKSYHSFLDNSGFTLHTVVRDYATIKNFYTYFDITPPNIKKKWTIDPIHESIDDIPTKKDIIKALNIASLKTKAIILTMATSGMDSSAIRNLTLKDFIIGIKDYIEYDLNNFNLETFIQTCRKEDNNDIIIYWEGFRKKTIKNEIKYYTFSSPESFTAIINYLEYTSPKGTIKPNKPEDYLFPGRKGKLRGQGITHQFEALNDRLKLGRLEKRRKFHSHALRKFFSNVLEDNEVGGRSFDHMMGHSPGKIKGTYVKPKKKRLLLQYKRCLEDLSMEKVIIQDTTPAQVKQIVKENVEIKKTQDNIAEQFTKILEFAKTDPEGFIKHMKKEEK